MKLTQLYMKNFGKFHEKKILLKDGINVIYGENESGKSTMHAFIRSMLFGMRRARGRASGKDLFSRCEPWENPAFYAGCLRFTVGERRFLLERNFASRETKTTLFCEDDGERLSVEEGDLKMLLGGIGENVFDNTVSLGQLKSQTDEGLGLELKNYMANYQDSSDAELDVNQALVNLKEKKKQLETCSKRKREERNQQEEQLLSRINYVEEEQNRLVNEMELADMQLKEQMFYKHVPEAEIRKASRKIPSGKKAAGLVAVSVVFLIILNVLQYYKIAKIFTRVGLAAAIFWLVFTMIRFWKAEKEESHAKKSPDIEEENMRKMRWHLDRLKEEIQEKKTLLENLQADYAEYREQSVFEKEAEQEIEAVNLAIQTIQQLSVQMQKQIGTRLRQKITEIFQELTQGKYTQVFLDEKMELSLMEGEHYVGLHQISRGTAEQVYFALRMAAAEILCKEEELPVFLDDTFAMYDEKRLQQALIWLARQKKQVLLFTCHKREVEILKQTGIPYHLVQL